MHSTTNGHLLIVDDDIEFLEAISDALRDQNFQVATFLSPDEALLALRDEEFDVLLCDLLMPDMNGVDLLRQALTIDPLMVGIIMTGQATLPTAAEAIKAGAFDYVLKPFKMRFLMPVLHRAMQLRRLAVDNARLRDYVRVLREWVRQVAPTPVIDDVLSVRSDGDHDGGRAAIPAGVVSFNNAVINRAVIEGDWKAPATQAAAVPPLSCDSATGLRSVT